MCIERRRPDPKPVRNHEEASDPSTDVELVADECSEKREYTVEAGGVQEIDGEQPRHARRARHLDDSLGKAGQQLPISDGSISTRWQSSKQQPGSECQARHHRQCRTPADRLTNNATKGHAKGERSCPTRHYPPHRLGALSISDFVA